MIKVISISKHKILLAIFSGVLQSFSLPNFKLWYFAWIAFVPLLIAIKDLSSKNAFKIGMITGIVHFLILLNWLIFALKVYSGMHWLQCFFLFFLFLFYLSIYPGIFSFLVVSLPTNLYGVLLVAPSSWVILEFLRGVLFTGFPWGFIGYSQFEKLVIIQLSDIFGVYGISFVIVIFNVGVLFFILFLFRKKWNKKLISIKDMLYIFTIVLSILLLNIFYGYWRIISLERTMINNNKLKIGIVQGNIDQSIKWDPAFQISTAKKYIEMSKLLKTYNPDLIVWPETAMPFCFGCSPKLTEYVVEGIKNINCNFIIGSPFELANFGGRIKVYYNSAYLVNNVGKIKARYDKSHLVPFGEYVPFRSILSYFFNFLNLPYDHRTGVSGNVIYWDNDSNLFGVQVCYEIVFPGLSRLMVNNGATLLVNLTNDAWFGNGSAAHQHFSMAIFRAVENRRSLIRSANTGISGFIDPIGRVLDATSIFEDEVLINSVPIVSLKTFYSIFGDFFLLFCVFILSIFFIKRNIVRYKNSLCLFF